MNASEESRRPTHAAAPGETIPVSLIPAEGWHCLHLYFRFDRGRVAKLDPQWRSSAVDEWSRILDPKSPTATARMQCGVVAGHKADFSLFLMDPDPLKLDAVQQSLFATELGPCLIPTYSFVSISEISEYVPTVEQYSQRLVREGDVAGSPAHQAKVRAYEQRLPIMNQQRLTPEIPEWPAMCFYPMNKMRQPGANWFTLPFSERNRLMAEHARSGMQYMGKVSQLITVGVGIEDWEWGVTLWAKNPTFLTDIVYQMRFDEASAKYAEFGGFYTTFVMSAREMLRHCRIID